MWMAMVSCRGSHAFTAVCGGGGRRGKVQAEVSARGSFEWSLRLAKAGKITNGVFGFQFAIRSRIGVC